MPRPDDGAGRQGVDSLPDGGYQLRGGSSGKIRASDSPHKERVAGKKVSVIVQAYPTRCVAGGMDNRNIGTADGDGIPVFQEHVRFWGAPAAKDPGQGAVGHGTQPAGIGPVDVNFGMGGCFDGSVAGNVVGMAVGVDDVGDPETRGFGLCQNFAGFKGRVDKGAGSCFFIADQIAENSHLGEFELFDYHHLIPMVANRPQLSAKAFLICISFS